MNNFWNNWWLILVRQRWWLFILIKYRMDLRSIIYKHLQEDKSENLSIAMINFGIHLKMANQMKRISGDTKE